VKTGIGPTIEKDRTFRTFQFLSSGGGCTIREVISKASTRDGLNHITAPVAITIRKAA
jgi:hypothetical protein